MTRGRANNNCHHVFHHNHNPFHCNCHYHQYCNHHHYGWGGEAAIKTWQEAEQTTTVIIVINNTRPKSAYGRQGLASVPLSSGGENTHFLWQTHKHCIIIYISVSSSSLKHDKTQSKQQQSRANSTTKHAKTFKSKKIRNRPNLSISTHFSNVLLLCKNVANAVMEPLRADSSVKIDAIVRYSYKFVKHKPTCFSLSIMLLIDKHVIFEVFPFICQVYLLLFVKYICFYL